ncbi:MAG: class A beta-lactamase-related serine hydrolase [Betaproteobacteria bacterium]|nr:class A beta-lactamase-related serine hydrolase [Betaproteobacteria bacterium]
MSDSLKSGRISPARRDFLATAGGLLLSACAPVHAQPRAPRLAVFDVMMADFLREHRVADAALAITRKGRLVYARGFGAAQAASPFRIASVSKTLTAAAVLRLAERGTLSLETRAWELLGLDEPSDTRWKRVTILNLLQHTAGWDRDRSFDPMFGPRALPGPRELLREMLRRPLDFDPGVRHAYSNFGYFLLGRVIERASGTSYEAHLRRELLAPLGISGMHVDTTWGRDPLMLDAHSGWTGSAVDLARFARAFDDRDACPILKRASIDAMFARPEGAAGLDAEGRPAAAYYGCGWMVRPLGRLGQAHSWHDGSVAGSSALLVRGYDGSNWAALFNDRAAPDGRPLPAAIDRALHRTAAIVSQWPDTDEFARYP